jgi:hypothetical protein
VKRAGPDGHYHLCGVPTVLALRSQASAAGEAARFTLRPRGERAVRQDFNLVAGGGAAAADSRGSAVALAPAERADSGRAATLAAADAPPRAGARTQRGAAGGYLIPRAEIERRQPRDVLELLRSVPGAVLVSAPGGGYDLSFAGRVISREQSQAFPVAPGTPEGTRDPSANLRCDPSQQHNEAARDAGCAVPRERNTRNEGGICPVRYYLDGQPLSLPSGSALGSEVQPNEVERIQVFSRAAEIPAEYARPGSECGVVLIWTRVHTR